MVALVVVVGGDVVVVVGGAVVVVIGSYTHEPAPNLLMNKT